MARPILFLKYAFFSERILFHMRVFLNLSHIEFQYLVCAVVYTINKKNKNKVFGGDEIAKVFFILKGKKIKDGRRLKVRLATLFEKGYFDFMFTKKEATGYMTYYTMKMDKIKYFLSVLNTFVDFEIKKMNSVNDIALSEIQNLAKKDVLKHIRSLKPFFKFK